MKITLYTDSADMTADGVTVVNVSEVVDPGGWDETDDPASPKPRSAGAVQYAVTVEGEPDALKALIA